MAPEANREKTNTGKVSFVFEVLKTQKLGSVYWCCGQVPSANDVRQTIEKDTENTCTTKQKRTNNSFRNTKEHPNLG